MLCTGVNRRKLSVASVWGRAPCKLQAVLCLDGGGQCEGKCGDVLVRFLYFRLAERCSRIIAKPPSESAVKAWFYNMTNSLQQIRNDEGAFPALFPRRILTLVSNCRNFRSASPSFSKDGCTHTVKSVLRLTKRPNNVTPRISAHEIHFCHTKTQQNDSCIKS